MCLNERYNKARTGKHMSDSFSIQNALNPGDALSPLLLNLASEYAFKNQMGLKLNWTYQLLAYAYDVNRQKNNIDTMKENTENLIDADMEIGLVMDVKKSKYVLLSCRQNICQNRDIKIANRSLTMCHSSNI
jgi:hypothetical protein